MGCAKARNLRRDSNLTSVELLRHKPIIDRTRWRLVCDLEASASGIVRQGLAEMGLGGEDHLRTWNYIQRHCPFDDETIALFGKGEIRR